MNYLIAFIIVLLGANFWVAPHIEQTKTFFPTREIEQTPQSLGLDYQDVYLISQNGNTINGWYIDNKNSEKVMLYFHGNAGNISNQIERLQIFYRLPVDLFIIDYQGYGGSEGSPSRDNCYADARAAYQYLISQKSYSSEQIFSYGYSLGGAIAANLAAKEKVAGVILEATFTSTKAIANLSMPLYRPFLWMMKQNFDTLRNINKINAPLLIIHRKGDERVPYTMAEELYAKAKEPKKLLLLKEGGHDEWVANQEYKEALREFVK